MMSKILSVLSHWLERTTLREGRTACLALCAFLLCQPVMTSVGADFHSSVSQRVSAKPSLATKAEQNKLAANKFAQAPLTFEQNMGQADKRIKYSASGKGYALALTEQAAWLTLYRGKTAESLQSATVQMRLIKGNRRAQITPLEAAPGVTHYYQGSDQSKWIRHVKSFARVQYSAVYPGVDLVWYSHQRELEYDFVVAPGADPQQIGWEFDGAESLKLDDNGNLVLQANGGELIQHAPIVYQTINGERRSVKGSFVLQGARRVGFALGNYDQTQPLVIDPRIGFSTYFGGDFDEYFTSGVAVTRSGETYLGGYSYSTQLPGEPNPETRLNIFVTKLNAQGTAPIFTAMLRGASVPAAQTRVTAVAVDGGDNVYLTGRVRSDNFLTGQDFPLVNAFQDRCNPGIDEVNFEVHDAFVMKLDSDGAIVYSTFLGGARSDEAWDIAVTSEGRAAVTGFTSSRNFPKKNQFQGNVLFASGQDVFVTVFEPDGRSLQYSTYFRGGDVNDEEGRGIGVDSVGNVYVTGFSAGNRLPTRTTSGTVFQPERSGGKDAFVAKFNPFASGDSSLVFCTYLGGVGTDEGSDVAVDAAFNVYVTGITGSTNFPLQAAAGSTILDSTNEGNEAFVTELNPTANSLIFSTFLGGRGLETNPEVLLVHEAENLKLPGAGRIVLDNQANIYVTGTTASEDFPTRNAVQPRIGGAEDLFLTKLSPGGKGIIYSTFWGGSQGEFPGGLAVDANQNVYISGHTFSSNFPVSSNALQREIGSEFSDNFVTKFGNPNADTIGIFDTTANRFFLRNSNIVGQPDVNTLFGQSGDIPVIGDWDGDGVETIGVFRQGTFLLCNSNVNPTIDITAPIGVIGDVPVVGDWDGDGDDTVGIQRGNLFLLTNDNVLITIGTALGLAGDIALSGDWDGDGFDTLGIFRQGTFFLTNQLNNGIAEITVNFGVATDLPVVGDWNGDGSTTIGVFRRGSRNNQFLLRNDNTSGPADVVLLFNRFGNPPNPFGGAGMLPLAGDYNGLP